MEAKDIIKKAAIALIPSYNEPKKSDSLRT